MDNSQTVVFDFDHTLTSWDSSGRFFRWLLTRSPWRMALAIVCLPLFAPILPFEGKRKPIVRLAVWAATFGRSRDDIAALARKHVAEFAALGQPLVLRDGARQLEQHLEQGHRVVIATGSLEVLAREFLDQSGLGHIPLVGSSLKPLMWGMTTHEHCYGPRKIPMLARRGYPPPWTVTYTDHECDLPVIGQSAEFFLVNPKPQAIQAVTHALASKPQVLAWQ